MKVVKSLKIENEEDITKIKKIDFNFDFEGISYLQDESHMEAGQAEAVYFPINEGQVSALLNCYGRKGIPITISGARTGVVGGAVPQGGILLSMEKMNKILGLVKNPKEDSWFIKAQPGVLLRDLQEYINQKNVEGVFCQKKSEALIYFYPPDPTESTAMLGGTIAANSSGARSYAYGSTRDYIHRLRITLSNGEILDITRGQFIADESGFFSIQLSNKSYKLPIPTYKMPIVKHAAGYFAEPGMDLIDLFIGSEGTLGVITYIELMLISRLKNIFCGIAFFDEQNEALNFVKTIKKEKLGAASSIQPSTLEYFDSHSLNLLRRKRISDGQGSSIGEFPDESKAAVFFEQFYNESDLEEIYERWQAVLENNGVNLDNTWGGFEEHDLVKMRDFRHALPEILNTIFKERKAKYPFIHKVSVDISVPEDALKAMMIYYEKILAKEELEFLLFGHIGESHLHLNILPNDRTDIIKAKGLSYRFAKKGVKLKGTVSAEHGIGKMKHSFLELLYGREGIQQMITIKLLLDPKGILNRGNIFSEKYLP